MVEELVELLEEPRTGFDRDINADINLLQPTEESQAFSAAPFAGSHAQRLLTGESCGPCPTIHQVALQVKMNPS